VVGAAADDEVGALLEDLLDEHPATVTATATAAPTALIDRRRVVLVFMTFPSMNGLRLVCLNETAPRMRAQLEGTINTWDPHPHGPATAVRP